MRRAGDGLQLTLEAIEGRVDELRGEAPLELAFAEGGTGHDFARRWSVDHDGSLQAASRSGRTPSGSCRRHELTDEKVGPRAELTVERRQ